MLLNDNRGSTGMFSRAGRNSTEKFHILMRKDEILSGINKKVKFKDIFTPEVEIKNTEEIDDDIDIFKTNENQTKNQLKRKERYDKTSKLKKQRMAKPKSEIAKYLEMKKKINNKTENPSCTKYNPKNEFIWKRVITGPEWEKSNRKNYSCVPREEIDAKFYSSHKDFRIDGRNFIDFGRQTKRASFIKEETLGKSSVNSSNDDSVTLRRTSPNFMNKKNTLRGMNPEALTNSSNENNDGYISNDKKKKESKMSNSNTFKNLNKFNSNPNITTNRWIKLQAPDFKKTISREQLERIYEDKRTIIPFAIPNFTSTTSRPIMMVKYDTNVYKGSNRDRPTSDQYTPLNYDPHKVLEKINNFKKAVSPDFNLMISRPSANDGDPLPSYMKQIHSRQSTEMFTDKALKMNNFSEGKFSTTTTSFWPKKSFNKIINLNLLNSAKFKENLGINTNEERNKVSEINDYVQKSMKFYNKNYDDLMKESLMNKFDNVTLKTIKRENKLETGDLEKFLINFEKIDP